MYSLMESLFLQPYEQIINESLFNKKKDNEIINNEYKELLSSLKKCMLKLKQQKDFKKKCSNYTPNLTVESFEDINFKYNDAIILIIDDDQDIRNEYRWILNSLVDILKEDYKEIYNKWNFKYGDGDEGCLYVKYIIKK